MREQLNFNPEPRKRVAQRGLLDDNPTNTLFAQAEANAANTVISLLIEMMPS